MVADPGALRQRPVELAAGDLLAQLDRLEHRAARAAPTAHVVDGAGPRRTVEGDACLGEVGAADVVAHLLALVAVDRVRGARDRRLHQVGEEPVELGAGVDGAGDAAAAQAARGHVEIAPVLLGQEIGGGLRDSEERVR